MCFFQLSGTTLSLMDFCIMIASGWQISSATSCRTLGWSLSGPRDLFTFRAFSMTSTCSSLMSMTMSASYTCVLGLKVGMSSFLTSVNTLAKNLFRIAFCASDVMRLPYIVGSSRSAILSLFFCLLFAHSIGYAHRPALWLCMSICLCRLWLCLCLWLCDMSMTMKSAHRTRKKQHTAICTSWLRTVCAFEDLWTVSCGQSSWLEVKPSG